MLEEQRFGYPNSAMMSDYLQAAAGAAIFASPLIVAWSNIYLLAILGSIVMLFVSFGWSTWRKHRSVIVVTDQEIAVEGIGGSAIKWDALDRVELRYFSTRRSRGQEAAHDRGRGWMQLRLDGEGAVIRIDSALDNFETVALRVAQAVQYYGIDANPTTKVNFAAIGVAPDSSWAHGG